MIAANATGQQQLSNNIATDEEEEDDYDDRIRAEIYSNYPHYLHPPSWGLNNPLVLASHSPHTYDDDDESLLEVGDVVAARDRQKTGQKQQWQRQQMAQNAEKDGRSKVGAGGGGVGGEGADGDDVEVSVGTINTGRHYAGVGGDVDFSFGSSGALDESITEHSSGSNIITNSNSNHGMQQKHEYFDGFTYTTSPATISAPESALPAPPTHLHHNKKHQKTAMYVS